MKIQLTILLGLTLTTCGTRETSESKPDPEAVKYNHLAVDQQLKGNFDSVLYYIDRAIEIDSTQYLYHYQRLQCLWTLNRNEEALKTAKKISRLRDYNNVSMEGVAYEKLGDIDKAKELYKQTIDKWPIKDLESSYQSRLEYSELGTIVYGRQFGLEEISKIDTVKLSEGEIEIVETIRRTIERYQGDSYQELMENINILPRKSGQ